MMAFTLSSTVVLPVRGLSFSDNIVKQCIDRSV